MSKQKFNSEALSNYIKNIDHHEIFKLHMLQVKSTRKEFSNQPEKLLKIDAIEEKIRATYADACAAERNKSNK